MKFEIIETAKDYFVALSEDKRLKVFRSAEANYNFNLENGQMVLWGKTPEDDPERFPAPNILDLECTDICTGINGKVCPFCYKANLPTNEGNMSFETFKKIFDKLPKAITQIAFGADSTLKSNPDLWKMMEYAREHYVIPNVTAAQIDDETADRIAQYCGACAISRYERLENGYDIGADICYDSIKRLTDRGMTQVNMHFMIAEETYDKCLETLNAIKTDPRLEKLNAIVLLSLKRKGRGTGFTPLSQEKFNNLCKIARENHIGLGFDSCSSLKVLRALGEEVRGSVLDCESTLQSSYISLKGEYFPCSFCEGEGEWKEGLDVLNCNNFIEDIWNNPKTIAFTKKLVATKKCNECNCRNCPMFEV